MRSSKFEAALLSPGSVYRVRSVSWGTLTALTFLDHYLGLPALLGLAALCVGLVDASLLNRQ